MGNKRILLIDSAPGRGNDLKNVLEFLEYDVLLSDFSNSSEILREIDAFCAVMIGDGTERLALIIKAFNKQEKGIPIVLVADKDSTPIIPSALDDMIVVVQEWPTTLVKLTKTFQKLKLFRESSRREDRRSLELFRSLAGGSSRIQKIRELIQQVAEAEAIVLILGESGTGKEVVARNLHYYSSRRHNPFVPVNCGAIPSELLESELFGHEKGAFTGALSSRQGRFEMAEGGTLFLDEIGDMPLVMQVKLLRVLQERTFERVGSNKTIECNVRIVAATHRNLEEEIEQNRFREDLFYRLNVFPIDVPALRERAEDIPVLVGDLIARIEHEKRGSVRFTSSAMQLLKGYDWPGNVRELANLVERLVILNPYGIVDVTDLPEKFRGLSIAGENEASMRRGVVSDIVEYDTSKNSKPELSGDGLDLREHLNKLECDLIRQALEESDGVVAHAAKLLRMRRTTLVEKMRKFNIQRHEGMTTI